jgi:hypothetical protein
MSKTLEVGFVRNCWPVTHPFGQSAAMSHGMGRIRLAKYVDTLLGSLEIIL